MSPFYEVISQKIFNFTKDGFPKFILLFPINLFHLSLGIQPSNIHIVGKVSRKQVIVGRFIPFSISQLQMALCDPLTEGYAAHLTKLSAPGGSVPAQGNARMVIPRFGFSSGKQSQEKSFFQNLLRSPWTVPTPAGAAAPSHSTLVANELEKVRKIGWICNAKIS